MPASTLPMVMLFLLLQRYYMASLVKTGLKL
jgi:ABC-type maltose transport system permease subunit